MWSDVWDSNLLSAWASVGNLTSRAHRGTGSCDYTWSGFYKTLWCVVIYYPESKCFNSLMPIQNLENGSSFRNCGRTSKSGICHWLLDYAQPLVSCFLQEAGQTATSTEREIWCWSVQVNLTHSVTYLLTAALLCYVYKPKIWSDSFFWFLHFIIWDLIFSRLHQSMNLDNRIKIGIETQVCITLASRTCSS